MSILVSFGEFFGEFFPLSHPCVCDTLLDFSRNYSNLTKELKETREHQY